MDLSLETRQENDRTVIEVGGEIDVYTAPKLRERIIELVDEGQYHLVVDLEVALEAFPYRLEARLDRPADLSHGSQGYSSASRRNPLAPPPNSGRLTPTWGADMGRGATRVQEGGLWGRRVSGGW